ncbi:DUF4259 domain-containing protein [Micromonospora sp. NPDC051296]|uniref:DUF4259 domain-containing protein n=1 Tax=Micromonospora sp. NPDC051296 TaxID=3155046 RepID=UPI00342384EF
MGTWDVGPFDSDRAADWCGDLDDAAAAQRPALVEAALTAVLAEPDYLESDLAVEAIAAAAIIAAHRPGGPVIESPYAPNFLLKGERMALDHRLDGLALRALDRVVADNSEWRELWEETSYYDQALDEVAAIRSVLNGSGPGRG